MFTATRIAVARASARSGAVTCRVARRTYAEEAAIPTSISLTFSSPHLSYYDNSSVQQVNVPGMSGEMGILANHVPVLTTLKPGVVSVFETADKKKNFFVSSGTVTINKDSSVQIVAEEAVPVEDIDPTAAKAGLDAATSRLNASTDAEKADAEISVEVHAAMLKALGSE